MLIWVELAGVLDYFQKGVFSSIHPVSGRNEWFKDSEKDINHYDPA